MRKILIAAMALLLGCASDKLTPLADIPKLTSLEDVMDNQKAAADHQFGKVGQASFTDAEFADFGQSAERLLVTSLKVKEFSKSYPKDPAGFEALAVKLNEKAKALGTAAAAKDASGAKAAITEMKATCRECHSKFK
jgi:cytochrome c556